MARSRGIEVQGVEDLGRALRVVSRDTAIKILRDPLVAASVPIAMDARRRAPVADIHRTGSGRSVRLKASIKTEVHRKNLEKGRVSVITGTSLFYGLFQELGWMPRGPGNRSSSAERRARVKGQRGIGYRAKMRGVGVGKSVGQPFLRPAFDAKKRTAKRIAAEGIGRNVENIIKRHLGKAA